MTFNPKLNFFTNGRNNNFNLIRMTAAFAVLVSHSYVLSTGNVNSEPFVSSLGMSVGSIAVDIFFITSGFLVTASLLNRKSPTEFIIARVLRVYPALLVMIAFTVIVLGGYFSKLPIYDYLTSDQLFYYIRKCSTLFFGISYDLPGVFNSNPYKNAINGSLWTMPHELRSYALLLIIWLPFNIVFKSKIFAFKMLNVVITLILGSILFIKYFHFQTEIKYWKLYFMFSLGSTFYVLQNYITLSKKLFVFFILLLLTSLIYKNIFFVVYVFTIAYILFYLAYIPAGWIRKYNKFGDYSYGMYIYSFPIQQSIAALLIGVSVYKMMLISTFVSLIVSILSWHLVEQKSLKLKDYFISYISQLNLRDKY